MGAFGIAETQQGAFGSRLKFPKELSEVHDTFHVSNLKKCLADANLHVPLDEIQIDKTLHFASEVVSSGFPIVKVRRDTKRDPKFTWEREDHMKAKHSRLFVDNTIESSSTRYCFEVYDHLILSASVSGDEYSICSRIVIMEGNGVLHAMLRQNWKLRFEHSGGLLDMYPCPELEGKSVGYEESDGYAYPIYDLFECLIGLICILDILYYEVLDIPLQELQGQVAFHHATKDEGELALAFGELLRNLWTLGRSAFAP
ncbi:hypothetical protein Tco_0808162 [Tanacetum coccineum]